MRHPLTSAPHPDQRGAALLGLMLLFFLGGMSWLLAGMSTTSAQIHRDRITTAAMSEAKAALIGRAAQDAHRPGSLTCPDTDDDGIANQVGGNCDAYLGRLPWKTLDLPDLRDGQGERLWYALTPELRDNPAAEPINSLTPLSLSIDGAGNIAALLFSAGPPLASQSGRPSNNAADFLDGSNGDGDSAYISGVTSPVFNDKVLVITRDDIFRVANLRVLAEIRGPDDSSPGVPQYGLRRYHAENGSFPWADGNDDGSADTGVGLGGIPYNDLDLRSDTRAWLLANKWFPLVKYRRINADSAITSIGNNSMSVLPCPASPCP